MRTSNRSKVPRPTSAKNTPTHRVNQQEQRERILRERVAYMLWVMANQVK